MVIGYRLAAFAISALAIFLAVLALATVSGPDHYLRIGLVIGMILCLFIGIAALRRASRAQGK